jgi:hypothetical protein
MWRRALGNDLHVKHHRVGIGVDLNKGGDVNGNVSSMSPTSCSVAPRRSALELRLPEY